MQRSAVEKASFSRGSTPTSSPNPPLRPNEKDDVGLRHFTVGWNASSISQRDTITGGRPSRPYPTLYQVREDKCIVVFVISNSSLDWSRDGS